MTDPAQIPYSDSPVQATVSDPASSYVNDYTPPSSAPQPDAAPVTSAEPAQPVAPVANQAPVGGDASEALESQNIFELLGVKDGSDEEKEAFLDELQQVIWEDFLENDVALLITEDEHQALQKIMLDEALDDSGRQEQMIVYLEKLIPDLEQIMMEKALELKEDMVSERLSGMREYYVGQAAPLQAIEDAQALIADGKWRSAANVLNAVV